MTEDALDADLLDAMNAALLEDSASENLGSVSGHDSLLSVDVMDEAMLVLMGDGEIRDSKSGEDTEEEEIDFADFLAPAPKKDTSKNKNKLSNSSNSSGDEESDNSPTSVIEEGTISKRDNPKSPQLAKSSLRLEQPQVVPLQQFENALALIQDLENRVHVLETDRQCLLEENEQLRETTNQQATSIADMEHKLERFPKLMEQTVQEEAKMAAEQAQAKTKESFWKKDMARQEQEHLEEMRKKNRVGEMAKTTDSLKQSDFLEDVVERKEPPTGPRIRPVAIFNHIRGWGNRNIINNINNNNNNNNGNTVNHNRDGSKKESSILPPAEGAVILASNSHDGTNRPHRSLDFDGDDPNSETNSGIEDDEKDAKVLDLMT